MDKYTYNKKSNIEKLQSELTAAGYLVDGLVYDEGSNRTTVMLKDTETKDPTSIVTAHVYIAPIVLDYKADYAAATTDAQRLMVLAKIHGLI